MRASFFSSGNIIVECERIWCCDVDRSSKPVELYAENGKWNIHFLRTNKDEGLFSQRNIMVAFSFESFPFNVKQCIMNFYAGENTIDDSAWGVIKDSILVDSGQAIFCNQKPDGSEVFRNTKY